jgi:hypothetical protein
MNDRESSRVTSLRHRAARRRAETTGSAGERAVARSVYLLDMTPERFWELVGTLDGVADDMSCAELDALLRETGEGSAFADILDPHVESLVRGCRWPNGIAGSDTMNWVAAAVVAAGRSTYEIVLAAQEVNPDQWQWGEAEALLVAGAEESEDDAPPDHGDPVPPVRVALQWLSVPSPEGVPGPPDDDDPTGVMDPGDDPDWGRVPVHDPDWVAARERLAADQSFLERRARLGDLGLWLTVRPVPPEGQTAPDPDRHSPFDGIRPVSEAIAYRFESGDRKTVVLVVPNSDFPVTGSRVECYVAAVHRLLEAAED